MCAIFLPLCDPITNNFTFSTKIFFKMLIKIQNNVITISKVFWSWVFYLLLDKTIYNYPTKEAKSYLEISVMPTFGKYSF